MKLSLNEAKNLILNNPDGKMPENKQRHCLEVGRVARVIATHCGLDGDMAEVLGMIHDIGDIWNDGRQHPFIGYKYIKSLGYDDEYANICLTHSFIGGDPNCTADGPIFVNGKVIKNDILPWENEQDSHFVLDFLKNHKYTEIEEIINLCDLMVTDKIIGLDRRLMDLLCRKGAFITTQNHVKTAMELQSKIEAKMKLKILDAFPEIIENLKAPETYRSSALKK